MAGHRNHSCLFVLLVRTKSHEDGQVDIHVTWWGWSVDRLEALPFRGQGHNQGQNDIICHISGTERSRTRSREGRGCTPRLHSLLHSSSTDGSNSNLNLVSLVRVCEEWHTVQTIYWLGLLQYVSKYIFRRSSTWDRIDCTRLYDGEGWTCWCLSILDWIALSYQFWFMAIPQEA